MLIKIFLILAFGLTVAASEVGSIGCALTADDVWLVQYSTGYFRHVRYLTVANASLQDYNQWTFLHGVSARSTTAPGYRPYTLAVSEEPDLHAIIRPPHEIPTDYSNKGTYYICLQHEACPQSEAVTMCQGSLGNVIVPRADSCPPYSKPMFHFFTGIRQNEPKDSPCTSLDEGLVKCPDDDFVNLVQYRAWDDKGLVDFKYTTKAGAAMENLDAWKWMFSFFVRTSSAQGFKSMELIENTHSPGEGYFRPPASHLDFYFHRVAILYVCIDVEYCPGFVPVRSCATQLGSFLTCAQSCPGQSTQTGAEFLVGVQGDALL